MNVNEASAQLGIPVSTLHYYEKKGLIKPQRKDNNYRDYTAADIHQLKMIFLLKEFGFTIADIRRVLFWNDEQTDYREYEREAKDFFTARRKMLRQRIAFLEKTIEIIDNLPLFSVDSFEYSRKQEIITELIGSMYQQYQKGSL